MSNGLSGLRPSYGRVSRFGAMPLSRTMDKLGPLTRSVEDLALVMSAIHGPDDRDPTAARDVPFRWDGQTNVADLKIGIDAAATGHRAVVTRCGLVDNLPLTIEVVGNL